MPAADLRYLAVKAARWTPKPWRAPPVAALVVDLLRRSAPIHPVHLRPERTLEPTEGPRRSPRARAARRARTRFARASRHLAALPDEPREHAKQQRRAAAPRRTLSDAQWAAGKWVGSCARTPRFEPGRPHPARRCMIRQRLAAAEHVAAPLSEQRPLMPARRSQSGATCPRGSAAVTRFGPVSFRKGRRSRRRRARLEGPWGGGTCDPIGRPRR